MTFRWMLTSDDGVTWDEVYPSDVPAKLVEWVNSDGVARATKRMQIGGELSFSKHRAQYAMMKALSDADTGCLSAIISLEIFCNGEWNELWRGNFAVSGGSWDYDKCHFSIKPLQDDEYKCLEERWGEEHNILQIPGQDFDIFYWPSTIQIWATLNPPTYDPSGPVGPITLSDYGWVHVYTQTGGVFEDPDDGCGTCSPDIYIYWREKIDVPCVGGSAVPPAGTGWTQINSDLNESGLPDFGPGITCLVNGYTRWVRTPTISWPFDTGTFGYLTVHAGTMGPGGFGDWLEPDLENVTCLGSWHRVGYYTCNSCPRPLYVCMSGALNPTTISNRARPLQDVVNLLIERTGCGLSGVRSDFFEWDPIGDAPGYVPGMNYVTGTTNQHSNILVLQKSDMINPTASQAAVRGYTSLKKLITALSYLYQIEYSIENGYLRIEHYSFFHSTPGLDTTTYDTIERQAFKNISEEGPKVERLKLMEARGLDFIGKDIIYSGPCIGRNELRELEYDTGQFTTDLGFIISEPTAIDPKGFALVATTNSGSGYLAILDTGAISGNPATNAPLSTANLMRDFWTYNRYLPEGNMNGTNVVFDGFRPTREQVEITVRCFGCEALNFNGDRTITTRLGNTWGVAGIIEKASLDTKGNLRITARYSK